MQARARLDRPVAFRQRDILKKALGIVSDRRR